MTFREVQAILLLFQSCNDPKLRQRVIRLIPELEEWQTAQLTEHARRWLLTASADGETLGTRQVVCRECDLEPHKKVLASEYDLAVGIAIYHTELP